MTYAEAATTAQYRANVLARPIAVCGFNFPDVAAPFLPVPAALALDVMPDHIITIVTPAT